MADSRPLLTFLALARFAFLAAVYLTVEVKELELQKDFRRMALGAAVAVGVCASAALFKGRLSEIGVMDALLTPAWRPLSK